MRSTGVLSSMVVLLQMSVRKAMVMLLPSPDTSLLTSTTYSLLDTRYIRAPAI